jgi:hypothetical protein
MKRYGLMSPPAEQLRDESKRETKGNIRKLFRINVKGEEDTGCQTRLMPLSL